MNSGRASSARPSLAATGCLPATHGRAARWCSTTWPLGSLRRAAFGQAPRSAQPERWFPCISARRVARTRRSSGCFWIQDASTMDGAFVLDDLFHRARPRVLNAPMLARWGVGLEGVTAEVRAAIEEWRALPAPKAWSPARKPPAKAPEGPPRAMAWRPPPPLSHLRPK